MLNYAVNLIFAINEKYLKEIREVAWSGADKEVIFIEQKYLKVYLIKISH